VMDLLEHLSIPYFKVQIDFGPDQSSLLATGILQIGNFELDLLYIYTKEKDKDKVWRFQAQLGIVDTSTKLVDLLESLDPGSGVLQELETVPFIKDIEFPKMEDAPASPMSTTDATLPDDAPVYFSVSHSDVGLTIWLKLEFDTPAGN